MSGTMYVIAFICFVSGNIGAALIFALLGWLAED